MSLPKAVKNLKFDKRVTDWNIANDKLTKDEWTKHLEALPDMAGKTEQVTLQDSDDLGSEDIH